MNNFKNKKKCNICFENKIIKNKCNTCEFLMCYTCYNSYLQYNNTNCAHCKSPLRRVNFVMDAQLPEINIIIERNQNNNVRRRNRNNELNFCNWYTLIIIIIFLFACYFIGYSVTGTHKIFFFFNFFLGFLILGVCLLLIGIMYDTFKNCFK